MRYNYRKQKTGKFNLTAGYIGCYKTQKEVAVCTQMQTLHFLQSSASFQILFNLRCVLSVVAVEEFIVAFVALVDVVDVCVGVEGTSSAVGCFL